MKRLFLLLSLMVIASLVASCGPTPEPQVIEKIVTEVVEKTVVETVVVEGTPEVVEKVVTEVVEVESVVTATPEPRGGDTLGMRLGEDPETLDNVMTISLTASEAMHYIHDRLWYFDGEGKVAGQLAESWEVSDDQTTLTVKVREGVKFHDGTDFNAAAVKFHFDRILDEANASPVLPYVGSLYEVNVLDDYTVEFKFEEPYAAFFLNMSYSYGGINSPTAVEEWGDEYGRHPVGAGPFMFEDWLPGSQITLIRNPDYKQFRTDAVNQGPPLAEKIILYVISEDSVAQAALETGEIIVSGLSSDAVARFVSDSAFNVVVDKNATNLTFLEFNHQKPPFDNVEFRKALGYAIDNEAIVQAARDGYADAAYSLLAQGIPGHDAEVAEQYGMKHDPEKALQMLADLGWVDSDGDGILDKDGQPAKFVIRSYAGFNHITRSLEVIQENFRDIGIEVELETSDWGAFYDSLWEEDWDMDLMRWTWGDPVVLSNLFRSPGHTEKLPEDPELDETLDRCDVTMDPELRAECVSEAQKLLLEKAIAIPNITNWVMFVTIAEVQDYTLGFNGELIPGDVWLSK
jgi:peptide/nickel transport system substrate-binding protein